MHHCRMLVMAITRETDLACRRGSVPGLIALGRERPSIEEAPGITVYKNVG